MLIKPQSFVLYKHVFIFNKSTLFQTEKNKKLKSLLQRPAFVSLLLILNAYFPLDYILLAPCLKNTSCVIQFYQIIIQQQRLNNFLNEFL